MGFSWRVSMAVPAGLLLITAVFLYFGSVDSAAKTMGLKDASTNSDLQLRKKVVVTTSHRDTAITLPACWILAAQYGCSIGVEMLAHNTMALYFFDKFGLTVIQAAACATCFGLTNIFARATGALLSGFLNQKFGMRGRLTLNGFVLFVEGVSIIVFSRMNDLAAAVIVLVICSTFTQLAEGTTFAIVPYVNKPITDEIRTFVGVGGNVGAVVWSMIFLLSDLSAEDSFAVVGFCVMALSSLSLVTFLKGDYDGILSNPNKARTIGW